jgi:hypothetical protein
MVYMKVIDKVIYLGITLQNAEGWRNKITPIKENGKQTSPATNKCLTMTPNIKVRMLENACEMSENLSSLICDVHFPARKKAIISCMMK